MAQPSRASVTVDGIRFDAVSTNFGVATHHEGTSVPMMGSLIANIDVQVDINDTVNMPFASLRHLFDLANVVTREKIKDIKMEFWQDDSRTNVICSYAFRGWINHFNISSSGEANHTLSLSLQPAFGKNQAFDFTMGN